MIIMEKNRLEAFSDGVLAIIITIMVLELKIPEGSGLDDLLKLGPTLLAYLLSFMFVAIYWVNHHLTFQQAERINVGILWCNIAWLFTMSFIPFSTAWVGAYPTSWAPLCLYFADMALASITFHLMYYLIFCESGKRKEFKLDTRSIVSLVTYTGAAIAGGLCPVAAFIIVAVVSCWWIVPAKSSK